MASNALVATSSTSTVNQTQAGKNNNVSTPSKQTTSLPQLSLTPGKSTPAGKQAGSVNNAIGTPGRWIHPRVNEIIERRNATNFDSNNARTIAYSVAVMITSFYTPSVAQNILPSFWLTSLQPYSTYAIYLLQILLLTNIALACAPLTRKPDPCEDIPLTPSQRRLLGLPPMSRPATPQEQAQYITPPRFSRSNTPQSTTSSLHAELSGSPLSGRGFDSAFRNSGASPFDTPNTQQRGEHGRRLSFASNRSSPLSISEFDAIGNTSTPTKATRASVGLNSKWLYEKGRGSPRSSLGGSGWGGGF